MVSGGLMVGLLFDDPSTRFFTSPATWTPLTLGSAIKGWWSADDHGTARMTDDGAGLISNWVDKAGSMAVTAATTARPTWAANSFNSAYAGLTFDAAANCFVSTTLTSLPTGATASDIYIMTTAAANGLQGLALVYGSTAANQSKRILKSTLDRLSIDDGSASIVDVSGALSSSPVIIGAQYAGTTVTGWKNGAPTNAATGTIASLNTGTTRLRIGASIAVTAAGFWAGVVRHVVITTTLTTIQRQQLEGWLAWDSGESALLPSSHPYKLVRP